MGYKHKKEDIIAKGSELIRTRGYHNVGINDILKACGIPKGSFYNFFTSKEQFAIEILNVYGENSKKMIQQFLIRKSELSPLTRIESFYNMLIDVNTAEKFRGGCLLNNLSQEMGMLSDDIAMTAEKNFLQWLEVIGQCVKEGQDLKEINSEYSATDLAAFLHNGFFGTIPRMKVTRSNEYSHKWLKMTIDLISV